MTLQVPKAMYHAVDTRYNLSELPPQLTPRIEQQAQSVACLVHNSLFIEISHQGSTQYHISSHAPTLAYKLKTMFEESLKAHCPEEKKPPSQKERQLNYDGPFKNELSLGHGTAFLVGKQLILTAAHCIYDTDSNSINKTKLASLRVLFGFQTGPSRQVQTTFESKDVYRIESVWQYHHEKDKTSQQVTADWAILQLDREVEGRDPLSLVDSRELSLYTPLYMLGHPSGLPLKLTLSGQVQKVSHPHVFETDLDAYAGNSGSPVFANDTGNVVGMLLGGNPDYTLSASSTKKKTIQISKISAETIERLGYEKCHKIASIDFVKTVLSSSFKMAHSHFSGRTKYLANLKAHLAGPSLFTRVHILYGPSGIGKSELATAFANQRIEDFSFIWSIPCGTEKEQFVGYQNLAMRLAIHFEEKEKLSSLIEKVHRRLEKNESKPWLLLFDNLQTPPTFPSRGGSVIITSYRNLNIQSLPQGAVVATELLPLESEEALKFLKDVTGKLTEDCKKLLSHIGCYPLLLGQVASYIKHTGMEIKDYLANLQTENSKMALEAAFGMTLKQLIPPARQWLFLCSRLNAALIPLSYLKAWLSAESISENETTIIVALEEHALLRYNAQEEVFSLHLEFQRILKSLAPSETMPQVVRLLIDVRKDWNLDNTNNWTETMKKATVWASHAEPVIEAAWKMPLYDLERAYLLDKLGCWEYASARYGKALGHHSEALKIRRDYLGWDHPDIATSLNGIGKCYESQGNYKEALMMHGEAFEIRRAALGKNHLEVATSLNNIGNCYGYQGNDNMALKMYGEALQIRRAALGAKHPDVATSLNNIAICYYSQGNYNKALKIFGGALKIYRALWKKIIQT